MDERTEGAALSGSLQVVMGGRVRNVPVLKLRQSKEWKDRLGSVAAGIELDDDLSVTIARVANLAAEVAMDLVVAYDLTVVLGGRDAIEEEATDAELFAVLEQLVKVTYPFEGQVRSVVRSVAEAFGPQLRTVAMAVMANVVGQLSRASSTPTPSGTGDSTPTPSRSVSPTNSSSSSGRTTRSPRLSATKSVG